LVIKPLEEDLTPVTVKPLLVSPVEPVAYQFQLWAAAVDIAGQHGLYRAAKVLRLDYAALKKRLATASAPPATSPMTFVELVNPAGANAADCVIELEGAGGGRMRIQMKITPPEVASLIQAWRASEA
jgi:hypothetical protein